MACGGAFYLLGEVDIVIAAEHATFFDPHVTFGMTAAFESVHMLQKMPFHEIMRIALTGSNERMSAQRAYEIGFVTEVVPSEELFGRLPRTRITHDNKAVYTGWLQHRLLLNRCDDCGHWRHPPRPICPECWSTKITPTPVSGRGTVHLLIKLHQGLPADGVDY